MKRMMYEIEWIWQAKTDITLPSWSTEIMRMNESLELDVHRVGIPYFPPPIKILKWQTIN